VQELRLATASSQNEELQDRAGRMLFAATIFAAAFLLFVVQPLVGKRILPWFGGAPAVWTLCLAFYQSMLFLGYVYAHLLIRFVRPVAQVGVHAVAVCSALLALPVLPSGDWRPDPFSDPSAQVLTLLTANVALPFLVLASTGPLIQSWFARRHPRHSPYPLYALSNVGSLLALLAYPFFLEPRLALSRSGTLWSWAFAATGAALLGCAVLAGRSPASVLRAVDAGPDADRGRADPGRVTLWLGLAGCAVLMLMGVTNKLCIDVASVPFLWILPLGTYLVTFILCFSSSRSYRRGPYVVLTLLALVLGDGWRLGASAFDPQMLTFFNSVYLQLPSYCVLLFGVCMIMHGELYRLRPAPSSLTAFYLCVSGGGALGGLFVGILAPLVFDRYLEVELGLVIAALLLLACRAHGAASVPPDRTSPWRRALATSLLLALIGFVAWQIAKPTDGLRYQERSFFGILRVFELGNDVSAQRRLTSGSTLHGVQFLDPRAKRLPTSYYGQATGLGLTMASRNAETPGRVGVIGLGVGTLAAYGREGEVFRFYEVDPTVVRIARDDGLFTFLADSPARIETVVGDGRLSLATEQARGALQSFDVLVLDAFSSDAIPVHLLTREAFAHYVAALAPGGLIAVHVTNRHFDLMPLVARLALEVGLASLQVKTPLVPRFQSQLAAWVLLSPDGARIDDLAEALPRRYRAMGLPPESLQIRRTRLEDVRNLPVWTDDYSDLFSVLRPLRSLLEGMLPSPEQL